MTKTTRRAFFSSIVALIICLTMLIGTTFAWFTDTASTAVNTIVSGNLDVDLEVATQYEVFIKDNGEIGLKNIDGWESAVGQTLDFVKAEGHENEEILWEPGCTYVLPPIRVVNNGNLSLKFKVAITGIDGDAKLNDVIEWIVPETYNYDYNDTAFTLDPGAFAAFKIAGHMKEDAGNEYQGLSINGIAITVYATQAVSEYDSIDNTYDADATLPDIWDGTTETAPTTDAEGVYHITSAAEFVQYINELNNNPQFGAHRYDSAKVVLDCDIDLGGHVFTASNEGYAFDGQFDGQGHTVSNYTVKRTDGEYYTGLFSVYMSDLNTGKEVFIKNLTVKNATVISNGKQVAAIVPSVCANATVDNCHAIDCTVVGVKKVGAVVAYVVNGTVSNCSAENCNVYCTDSRENQATVYGYNNGGTFTNNAEPVNCTVTAGVTAVADGVVLNNNVYEIYNADGMFWFAGLGTEGQYNKNVTLTADIDLGNKPWTPLCDSHTQYGGTFDGNGHTIYGLNIKDEDAEGNEATGLFAWSNGTIKNLTIAGATVVGNHWVGAVVGYMQAGTIENCTVKNSTVKAVYANNDRDGDKAGAVVGLVNQGDAVTTVTNCKAVNCKVYAVRDAGQVVGCANATDVTNCTAENVTVTAISGYTTSGNNIRNDVIGRN